MSRVYDALTKASLEKCQPGSVQPSFSVRKLIVPTRIAVEELNEDSATSKASAEVNGNAGEFLESDTVETAKSDRPDWLGKATSVTLKPLPAARLVAWSAPNSLGAEKFRALVTRLDHIRKQTKLHSVQVISSVANEGKSFVAANLAVTLARHSGAKTLLIDGDLHGPTLSSQFGLNGLRGLSHWWAEENQELGTYLRKFNGLPLWFLGAGTVHERPSEILRSSRLALALASLAESFDWIVVDSTPMLPVIDANLWSRLVSGTLLVAREGVTPVSAIKEGLRSLDHPNLVGVVLNEASDCDQVKYYQGS